jgi:hypothetical protein
LAFLDYLEGRRLRLLEPLTTTQLTELDDELARLVGDQILILRHGEIEDHLPPDTRDVKAIVELTTDRNWINRVPGEPERRVLAQILCEILEVKSERRTELLNEAIAATVAFPAPLS